AEAHHNLGLVFRARGEVPAALDHYRTAVRLKPDYIDARLNLALALLLSGDYAAGWPEYEWRWETEERKASRRAFAQPMWSGEDCGGRTVLLHGEQGYGDALQFIRYAPLLAARGARVIVECQRELKRLLAPVAGIETLVAQGEPLPDFELHCPLLSL